jgi:protein-tyrosine phosphatase
MNKKPFSILFVCTGNICRSPTAEAVFRHQIRTRGLEGRFTHDSAGVASHHIGHPPDTRSQAATLRRAIDMSDLRARDIRPSDFYDFDLILAMDESHLKALKKRAPEDTTAEIALYLPHSGHGEGDVPDPYYGGIEDFEHVYALIDRATDRLLAKLTT